MLIAQRTLRIVIGPKAGATVTVGIHMPEQSDGTWLCFYQIDWPDRPRRSFGAGVDSIQALIAAQQKIGVELYNSTYHKDGALVFETEGKGYGFPVPKSMRDVLVGDDMRFDGH